MAERGRLIGVEAIWENGDRDRLAILAVAPGEIRVGVSGSVEAAVRDPAGQPPPELDTEMLPKEPIEYTDPQQDGFTRLEVEERVYYRADEVDATLETWENRALEAEAVLTESLKAERALKEVDESLLAALGRGPVPEWAESLTAGAARRQTIRQRVANGTEAPPWGRFVLDRIRG